MVRLKHRYLVVQLSWPDGRAAEGLTEQILLQAVRDSLATCHGDIGLGSALLSLQVKYYCSYTHVLLLRCDRDSCVQVQHALALLTTLMLRRVQARLVRCAGTARTGVAYAIKLDQDTLHGPSCARLPAHHMVAAVAQLAKLAALDV